MKRALSLILTLAMLLALFSGCTTNTETPDPSGGSATPGTSSDATPPAGGDAADTIDMSTVYTPYCGALFSLPYFIDHRVGIDLAGKFFGTKTACLGPSEYDMSALTSAIEQQISQNPTALFVSAFEDTVAPAIDKAVDAGTVSYTHLDVYKRQITRYMPANACSSFPPQASTPCPSRWPSLPRKKAFPSSL